jgi:hypothetical protein
MNRFATGLKVRFRSVAMFIGHGGTGNLTGNILNE